jgi:5'-3' exonuclease
MKQTYIFVDASYFIFFRYYALKSWWGLAHRDEELNTSENLVFKEKFIKTVEEKLKELPKKLGIKKGTPYKMFFGKDCPQSRIWRFEHHSSYKEGRPDSTEVGHYFALTYKEKLFESLAGDSCILFQDRLEADDVIALSVRHILETAKSTDEIYVVTGDMDYIQLANDPRVHLYDLKFKSLRDKSKYFKEHGNPEKDILIKCIGGDKSDNIPAAFPKCGKKTAEKLAAMDDAALFAELAKKDGLAQFHKNVTLVCFSEIPKELSEPFIEQHKHLFEEKKMFD